MKEGNNKMKKIGVFVDCENTSIKTIEENIRKTNLLGEIVLIKAFAHHFEEQYKRWKKYENIMQLIACPKNSTLNKSSTDMTMALHCLNDTKNLNLDLVVVISSDSDFIPLINMLNDLKKEIVIFGVAKSANALKNQALKFIDIL